MAGGVPKKVIDMMKGVPLLSGCNTKELREVANLGTELSVSEGKTLTKEGKVGREFFLLINGKAKCFVRDKQVATFGPGDFFGEMALIERGPRKATVVTSAPSEVLILNGAEFERLLEASPSITRKMLGAFAERERANASIRS